MRVRFDFTAKVNRNRAVEPSDHHPIRVDRAWEDKLPSWYGDKAKPTEVTWVADQQNKTRLCHFRHCDRVADQTAADAVAAACRSDGDRSQHPAVVWSARYCGEGNCA
ncbi:MAG: hypothetical protein AAGC70_03145 [Pseudomonadota bacterium]